MNVSISVGKRIKYYRNMRHMSLKAMSSIIHKSISTISKYESGQVSIDIDTLYEIAAALSVSITQLVTEPLTSLPLLTNNENPHFFTSHAPIYAYYYTQNKLMLSVFVPVSMEQNILHCHVFMESESAEAYTNSRFFLAADIHCFDSGAAIYLKNTINHSDYGFIYAKIPYSQTAPVTGLFSFSSEHLGIPAAVKMIFSATPLTKNDELINSLIVYKKATIDSIKKANVFVTY